MKYKAVSCAQINGITLQSFWLTLSDAEAWATEIVKNHKCDVNIYEFQPRFLKVITYAQLVKHVSELSA